MRSVLQGLKTLLFLITACSFSASAQTDTVTLMSYNLLNYGNNANPYSYKDPRLTTILQHVKPGILAVNEIKSDSINSQHLLDTVLGAGWAKGSYINTNNEIQTNMVFWKTSLFELVSEQSICSNLRDIIAYKLRYLDTITMAHDTVFVTVIVAHLKAGTASSDEMARDTETQQVVSYLNGLGEEGNYMFVGDFNVYDSNEDCYQNLVASSNPFSKLYDPINMPGNWHDDASFASVHTQSPRDTALLGGAGGGLDDRFDQQLVSNYIMNGTAGVTYLTGSYHAVGQDGLHFNSALTAPPTNNAAPANVITALYEMSDHLPVAADYVFHATHPLSVINESAVAYRTTVINPMVNNDLSIVFDPKLDGENVTVELFDIRGSKVISEQISISAGLENRSFSVDGISAGMYILSVKARNGYSYFAKVVKP